MAARMLCHYDPTRDILHLRPLRGQSSGPALAGTPAAQAASPLPPVSPDHRPDISLRALPACATSDAGPCVLRFTSADLRRLATPVNICHSLTRRARGHPWTLNNMDSWTWLMINREVGSRIEYVLVAGGCRHKLQ
ncbi:X protein [Tent-making bat hepatitis B virus]|uniref:Protein X n=1 Tax=Tent-making bat hepatitis B virus TaxID=1508712 RepID=U3M9Y5_9HEPA|nr:X protein [Tent-making bat hepatitis B virus]AGW01286.1 X protein [Tent-making bat hepatitis B virus]AGW01289.1 X protein [Tent-making bat hepatitis B virus]AGW01292.1 X protein [Tent-making bat hepatitis B virus]